MSTRQVFSNGANRVPWLRVHQHPWQVGITVHWRRRAWDATLFPHATRGYFPFWERIRSVG